MKTDGDATAAEEKEKKRLAELIRPHTAMYIKHPRERAAETGESRWRTAYWHPDRGYILATTDCGGGHGDERCLHRADPQRRCSGGVCRVQSQQAFPVP